MPSMHLPNFSKFTSWLRKRKAKASQSQPHAMPDQKQSSANLDHEDPPDNINSESSARGPLTESLLDMHIEDKSKRPHLQYEPESAFNSYDLGESYDVSSTDGMYLRSNSQHQRLHVEADKYSTSKSGTKHRESKISNKNRPQTAQASTSGTRRNVQGNADDTLERNRFLFSSTFGPISDKEEDYFYPASDDLPSSLRSIKASKISRRSSSVNSARIMPPYLLPFVPYVEKEMDAAKGPPQSTSGSFTPVDVVRVWLQTCEKLHCGHCGTTSMSDKGPWSGPLLLIDVEQNCLVEAPPNVRYIALSYVWGGDNISACATSDNIAKLQEPNGLDNDIVSLPRTIRDAMKLVRQLEENYLWVDRFCIIQDESIAKQSQLNAMGNIYAGAYFTLVAAQSYDVFGGLYDGNATARYHPPLPVLGTSGKQILLDQSRRLMRTKWCSRAWTFQEYLFSKRRVVFQSDTVNWECLYSAWHELQDMSKAAPVQDPAGNALRESNSVGLPLTGFKYSPWPDMTRYARLVSLFNQRKLTYVEDVLDAFAGILSHLSLVFPKGFISGLPQMCFDAALLWQPWTLMTRRKSFRRPASEAVLPSWSWAGWGGDLNSESWRSAANYLLETDEDHPNQQCSWKTVSTVKWNYSVSLTSSRKEIKMAVSSADPPPGEPLPSGWSRKPNQKDPNEFLYYHVCDPLQPFRYPIAIRDRLIAHVPPISASYLYCTTKHAFLQLGSSYNTYTSDCLAIDLLTHEDVWAGVLRLNSSTSDTHKLTEGLATIKGERIELIEISRGSVQNQSIEERSFDEWRTEGFRRYIEKGLYEFVNVLWIKWEDNVAYREALGRVAKEVWEEVAKETIDVTLG